MWFCASQSPQEGKALKLLATAARLDIEDFLQKKVYLEVQPLKYLCPIYMINSQRGVMHFMPPLSSTRQNYFQATLLVVRKLFTSWQPVSEQVEVKVRENWRQDEGLLKNYGYGGQIQALWFRGFSRPFLISTTECKWIWSDHRRKVTWGHDFTSLESFVRSLGWVGYCNLNSWVYSLRPLVFVIIVLAAI